MSDVTDPLRLLINVFIGLFLFLAWAWRHPVGTLGRVATEPFVAVVRWLGIGQNWSMFTPNPAEVGAELEVIVRRRSGAAIAWQPPRMHAQSTWGAFRLFRYRAYANAMMSTWASDARSTLADYVLRKYDFGDDPPVEVVYTVIEQAIAPPGGAPPTQGPVRSVFHRVAVPAQQP